MDALTKVLWAAGLALAAALVVKLALTGLFRLYAWFTAFLCFEILRSLILLPIQQNTNLYAWIFLWTQPGMWLLYILVVLELYSLALRGRKGIVTLSRWALYFSLIAAVAISAATLWADLSQPRGRYPILAYYSVVERGLIFSLALFLLFITAFLTFFPLPVTRNIRLHTATYSLYFLSSTMALFLQNVAGFRPSFGINAVLMFIALVCFMLWLGGLSRGGEESVSVRGTWQPEDEERLLSHLDRLNAAVLRQSRD
ncbi:MAG: hypothetical protein IT159_02490 [Bryobacterales bacterium]|nr:hypothetical protein [Bryobacterales bacterium]